MTSAAPADRRLVAFGLAVALLHHLGSVGTLGDAGGRTSWADWLDLATPYAVVGTALATLAAARPVAGTWMLAAVGAIAYSGGHGLHLAANSIGNERGEAAPVHLWDEVAGHAIWYAGLALLVLALSLAVEPVAVGPAGWALSGAVGLTWATNALGADGLVLPMLVVAAALAVRGLTTRHTRAGRLLLSAYGLASVALAVGATLG